MYVVCIEHIALKTMKPFLLSDSSLGRRHFNEGDLSRPPTGQKLSPIERRPSAGSLEVRMYVCT